MGEQVVTTKELQQIKDELEKLDLDTNYLTDEVRTADADIED